MANEWARLGESAYARSAKEQAVEYHARCLGKATCNCGHGVGVFVDWNKVATL